MKTKGTDDSFNSSLSFWPSTQLVTVDSTYYIVTNKKLNIMTY